jgi:hypothetical protein
MKTAFTILFALLMFYSHLSGQLVKIDKGYSSTKPIRSLKIVNPYQTQVVVFDRKGNEIERTLYKTDGTINHQVFSFYNDAGLKSGWKEYYGKGVANAEGLNKHATFKYRSGKLAEVIVYREDSIAHKSTYIYDQRGNKIQEINSGPDALFTDRNYKYDAADNLIEESSAGQFYSTRVIRVFDGFGNAVKEKRFDKDSLAFSHNRTYENGKLITEETFDANGAIIGSTRNSYNGSGKLVESTINSKTINSKITIQYDNAGWMKRKETLTTVAKDEGVFSSHEPNPGRVVIVYNEKGHEVERIVYSVSETLVRRNTSSYSEQGNLSEIIDYRANGEVESKLVYEYDQHGSLVKRSLVKLTPAGEMKHSIIEQRIISYY